MEKNKSEGLGLLDYPGEILDKITDLLTSVGIDIPIYITQGTLFLICISLLYGFKKNYWPITKAGALWIVSALALLIVVLGIVFNWINFLFNPFPDHIVGKVHSDNLNDIRIALLGFQSEQIDAGSGVIDSVTGDFVLRFRTSFTDRPRTIMISKPNCEDRTYPISRAMLRAQNEFILDYDCKAKQ